ncbi:MAG: hypothetical protein F6K16_10390 [Symploca sp. SIO2B6]|nr:hypothetical protein [Symploca sp. SIO2B6]
MTRSGAVSPAVAKTIKRKAKKKQKVGEAVRTDKWKLHPTELQHQYCLLTVSEYRKFVRALIGMAYTHWHQMADMSNKERLAFVETLIHPTAKRPSVKYEYFKKAKHKSVLKFPSYLRRAAIDNAIGQVSSFVTRYRTWQSGIGNRRDTKPPRLTADTDVYPALYHGRRSGHST